MFSALRPERRVIHHIEVSVVAVRL